ncbi:MAG: DUF2321 domain-containing protein [Deltaproteobacteria bacterium]|nr:DUF2321 domain-containing protein [Deltaproteobacteria bacterium]
MMAGYYDVRQVCENGHQITGVLRNNPSKSQDYCPTCGAKTLTKCVECGDNIRGYYYHAGLGGAQPTPVPSYCHKCGKPYPWTQKKISTATQIFEEFGGLDEKEKRTIAADINNIARDIPETELSARRLKAIWEKYGPLAYNLIMELATKIAAQILKNP